MGPRGKERLLCPFMDRSVTAIYQSWSKITVGQRGSLPDRLINRTGSSDIEALEVRCFLDELGNLPQKGLVDTGPREHVLGYMNHGSGVELGCETGFLDFVVLLGLLFLDHCCLSIIRLFLSLVNLKL